MGIVSVKEAPDRRSATMDEKGVRKYSRMFRVVTDSPLVDSQTVLNAPGLPSLFDSYSTDTGFDSDALLKNGEAREMADNPFLWEVDLHYSSDATDPTQGVEEPTDRPALYKWTNEIVRIPAGAFTDGEDLNGDKIQNSAGAPFDPPAEMEIAHRVLTITRNEEDFDPTVEDAYAFTTNEDEFMGYDAGQARMEPIEAEEAFEGAVRFWKKTYVIKFKTPPFDWQFRPLDQSLVEPDGSGGLKAIIDKNGSAVSTPVLFDGAGSKIDPLTEDPFYFDFQLYEEKDWSPLNLEGP